MNRLVIMIAGLVLAATAQAASFDCAKAGTKVEKLICADAGLSKLDEELNTAYKAALQDKKQAVTVRKAQKQWMKERNDCENADCVNHDYQMRLSSLAATHTLTGNSAIATEGIKDNSKNGQKYHFQITKGQGVSVCDAYLERLNTTKYDAPPFCDRPENDSINGFARLNRVPLLPSDVHDLFPIVTGFMSSANQKGIDWTDMNFQQGLTQTGQTRLTETGLKLLQMGMNGGWIKMWRYVPPIDIDNDGLSDNIEIWHGSVLEGVGGRQCGDDIPRFSSSALLRQPQAIFVITGSNDRLDVARTIKLFAHPEGGYPIHINGQWILSSKFRPIGKSMGIFKYQDMYYFDTFFDGWGDFEGKRKNDKNIINTLAVYLNRNGETKQVCEYLMTNNETQNKGEKK